MNYRLIRSPKSTRGRHAFALVATLTGAVILFQAIFPSMLGEALMRVARPLWRIEQGFLGVTVKMAAFFSSKRALIDEVARLQTELEEKEIQVLDRSALAEENARIKREFDRTPGGKTGILAAVLALPPRSLYDTLLLDAGAKTGVREGALIRIGPVALGTIVRVYDDASVAELFSAPGKKTPMYLSHASNTIPVEAEGQGGGTFLVTLPKETPVAPGDSILMAGMRLTLFGTVDSVDSTVTGSFQAVYFHSPVPLSSHRFVEIDRLIATP